MNNTLYSTFHFINTCFPDLTYYFIIFIVGFILCIVLILLLLPIKINDIFTKSQIKDIEHYENELIKTYINNDLYIESKKVTISLNNHEYNINYIYGYEIDNTNKPNLIMLHGLNSSAIPYIKSYHLLTKHYNVYSIDFIGFGRADINDNFKKLLNSSDEKALFLQRDILIEFIKSLNLSNIYLMGHSFGGIMALLISHRVHKNFISKTILVCTPFLFPIYNKWGGWISKLFNLNIIYKILYFFNVLGTKSILNVFDRLKLNYYWHYYFLLTINKNNIGNSYVNLLVEFNGNNSKQKLKLYDYLLDLDMPIGLIFADDDIIVDNRTGEILKRIHNIDIDILKNVNHNVPYFIDVFSISIIKMFNKLNNPSKINKKKINFNYDHINHFFGSVNVYQTQETVKLLDDYITHITT
jgi:pimeloyl-ACP methyl ester carboxylesterase